MIAHEYMFELNKYEASSLMKWSLWTYMKLPQM